MTAAMVAISTEEPVVDQGISLQNRGKGWPQGRQGAQKDFLVIVESQLLVRRLSSAGRIRKNAQLFLSDFPLRKTFHQDIRLHHWLNKTVLKFPFLSFFFQDWATFLLRKLIQMPNVGFDFYCLVHDSRQRPFNVFGTKE